LLPQAVYQLINLAWRVSQNMVPPYEHHEAEYNPITPPPKSESSCIEPQVFHQLRGNINDGIKRRQLIFSSA